MNLKNKKTLSREFLLLVAWLVLSGLSFVAYLVLGEVRRGKYHELDREVNRFEVRIDSLVKTGGYEKHITAQKRHHHLIDRHFNIISDEIHFWNRLVLLNENDSLNISYAELTRETPLYLHDIGVSSYQEYKKFVTDNTVTQSDWL